MLEVGESSRTDVALCYMEDRVDQELLKNLNYGSGISKWDDLRMNQQSLAECLFKRKWYNPFPKFKFTERPDTARLSAGSKVVILVDNSPSAMILPTSILDIIEEANDYYFPTLTGMYLKISRAYYISDHLSDTSVFGYLCRIWLAARKFLHLWR